MYEYLYYTKKRAIWSLFSSYNINYYNNLENARNIWIYLAWKWILGRLTIYKVLNMLLFRKIKGYCIYSHRFIAIDESHHTRLWNQNYFITWSSLFFYLKPDPFLILTLLNYNILLFMATFLVDVCLKSNDIHVSVNSIISFKAPSHCQNRDQVNSKELTKFDTCSK